MEDNTLKGLIDLISSFEQSLKQHLPALEYEVNSLILNKVTDNHIIERHLDTLLSLVNHGVGQDLFIKLLEYYKTIDAEGAAFYWNEYDKEEEEEF